MKTTMLLLAVLVSGCGAPGEYTTLCDTTTVGKLGGESDRLDCGRLWYNLALAKKYMMTETTHPDGSKFKIIDSEEEWANYFGDLKIHVAGESLVLEPITQEDVLGYYDATRQEIHLEYLEGSLLHELLHHLDTWNLKANTMNHQDWDTNGYYQVAGWYEASFKKPVGYK